MRHRLMLIALVLMLGAAALWQWQHDHAGQRRTLLSLDSAAVTRIDVLRHDQDAQHYIAQHYIRRQGHWWRQGPPLRRVDDARLQDLATAGQARVQQWRAASDFKLSLIGLQPPDLVVVLNGHRLGFGAIAATGPLRYVRVGGRIALIPAVDAPHPPSPDELDERMTTEQPAGSARRLLPRHHAARIDHRCPNFPKSKPRAAASRRISRATASRR